MFEEMEVGEILRDLRSIKVPPKTREFIDRARDYLEKNGGLSVDVQMKVRRICQRYRVQMKELHASRERARRTNGLKRMGITRAEAEMRVEQRRKEQELLRQDVGF